MRVVFLASVGCIWIWWYLENASRKLMKKYSTIKLTSASMCRRGFPSLGQAAFRLVKSTYIRHLPPTFWNMNTFEIHSKYFTSHMNFALAKLVISSLIGLASRDVVFLIFCLTSYAYFSDIKSMAFGIDIDTRHFCCGPSVYFQVLKEYDNELISIFVTNCQVASYNCHWMLS